MTARAADRDTRANLLARAGDTLAVVSLGWPVLVVLALELALRLAPWLDPQIKGSINTSGTLILARVGGRVGYVIVGELLAWLGTGLVVCVLAVAATRQRRFRFLAGIGGLVDVVGIIYASSLRF